MASRVQAVRETPRGAYARSCETYPEDASVVDEGAALVVVLVQVLRDRACTACQDLELEACMAAVQVHATDLIPAAVDDRV